MTHEISCSDEYKETINIWSTNCKDITLEADYVIKIINLSKG